MNYTYESDGIIQIQGNGSDYSTPHKAYESNDGVSVGGCSLVEFIIFIQHKYGIGDIVYNRKKALKGIIRRHTIKEVRVFPFDYDVNGSKLNRGVFPRPALYVDTYNAFHNENELIPFSEAVSIAQDAIDAEDAAKEAFIKNQC